MNSEELEQSLRAEFENYLKDATSEMKEDISAFQKKVNSEIEKHKSQLEEMFSDFSENFGKDKEITPGFKESVTEHLKLARDEGSKIAEEAFAKAEELRNEEELLKSEAEASSNAADFSDIRDAINEISSKDTQSEILKSLVHYASQFTPRGAFFIVKNEHFVGWRVFGTEEHSDSETIRKVYFPISTKTSLSESVETLATINSSFGTHEEETVYLDKLDFGEPENMYAIPLVARSRGVAVLYADNGSGDEKVNIEALETLMRVAGLTVEVLASTASVAKAKSSEEAESSVENDDQETVETVESNQVISKPEQAFGANSDYSDEAVDYSNVNESDDSSANYEENSWDQTTENEFETVSQDLSSENEFETVQQDFSSESENEFETPSQEQGFEINSQQSFETETQEFTSGETEPQDFSMSYEQETEKYVSEEVPVSTVENVESFEATETGGFEFESSNENETEATNQFDVSQFEVSETSSPSEEVDFSNAEEVDANTFEFENGQSTETSFTDVSENVEETTEEVVEEPTPPKPSRRSRFGDRNVDLPIDVTEDERRYHNDARRFARLLVSEIKLYNEQKVKEGREASDLYERLREAIDRSREMYDKRVQPPVASKFDYFNYELVNTLAEGDETRLGGSYPGASV